MNEALLPGDAKYSTPPQGSTYVAHSSGYGRHSNTGGIIALVAVLLVVAGVAAYLVFSNRSDSTGETVIDAQQAVTDALARVDMLPKEHPLRTYTAELRQWQGELKAYQEIKEDNPQITEKAERYRQKAEDISNQARAALASMGREPANVSPVQGAQNTNAASVKDEDAAKATEGEQAAGAEEGQEKSASETDTKADEKSETEGEQDNANKNRPRRATPPLIDPVKSDPDESGAKNSNSRRANKPPVMDKINGNERTPDSPLHR